MADEKKPNSADMLRLAGERARQGPIQAPPPAIAAAPAPQTQPALAAQELDPFKSEPEAARGTAATQAPAKAKPPVPTATKAGKATPPAKAALATMPAAQAGAQKPDAPALLQTGIREAPEPASAARKQTAGERFTSFLDWAKKMGQRHKRKLVGIAFGLAVMGLALLSTTRYRQYKSNKENAALATKAAAERKQHIEAMATEFRRCRAEPQLPKECLSEEGRKRLETSAKWYEDQGNSKEAGLLYVKLENNAKIKDMITNLRYIVKDGNAVENPDQKDADELTAAAKKHIEGIVADPDKCVKKPPEGCPGQKEIKARTTSAQAFEAAKNYKEAGLAYVELAAAYEQSDAERQQSIQKANEMMDKCRKGDEKLPDGVIKNQDLAGAQEINDALNMLGESQNKSLRKPVK